MECEKCEDKKYTEEIMAGILWKIPCPRCFGEVVKKMNECDLGDTLNDHN